MNQSDDVEKSWQVQQMREVYNKAEQTPIFLGPKDDCSDAAINLLHRRSRTALEYGCFGTLDWRRETTEQTVYSLSGATNSYLPEEDDNPIGKLIRQIMNPCFHHDYMYVSEVPRYFILLPPLSCALYAHVRTGLLHF
jgi:hypothetical protein